MHLSMYIYGILTPPLSVSHSSILASLNAGLIGLKSIASTSLVYLKVYIIFRLEIGLVGCDFIG